MKIAVTIATIVALASVASADKKERADALFKDGKKLMAEKRYADPVHSVTPGLGMVVSAG